MSTAFPANSHARPPSIEGLALEADAWLGEMLGKPAMRVVRAGSGGPGGRIEECLLSGPVFVTAKVPVHRVEIVASLESLGFRVVDTALTFDAAGLAGADDASVRFASEEDRAAVVGIASRAFVYSRFHLDPLIPREIADRIKGAWADNFFAGDRGDAMIVALAGGRVAGFLQLLRERDDGVVIDLIAVDAAHARRGLARAMIGYAARRGAAGDAAPAWIRVGTQAANTPSVRLYESLGFRLRGAQHVLHHHGVSQGAPGVTMGIER